MKEKKEIIRHPAKVMEYSLKWHLPFDIEFSEDDKLVLLTQDVEQEKLALIKYELDRQSGRGIGTLINASVDNIGSAITETRARIKRGTDGYLYLTGEHEWMGRTVLKYDNDLNEQDNKTLRTMLQETVHTTSPDRIFQMIEHQGRYFFMTEGFLRIYKT